MLITADPSEITEDALNRLLDLTRQRSLRPLPRIASVRATPLDGGNGYISQVFRLNIDWNDKSLTSVPQTLVAKLPQSARLANISEDVARMYRREVMFHREVAPTAPLKTPEIWAAELSSGGAAMLIFKDLGSLESFSDCETVSIERITSSLRYLAQLHAKYWNSSELNGMNWLAHPAQSGVDQVPSKRFNRLWPALIASGAYKFSPTLLHLGEMLRTKMDEVYEALHAGPETLIHADLHQQNLFFDGPEPVFIDWQLAERGSPAKDIAKLTASCLEPGTVSREQPTLIRKYLTTLQDAGVNNTSLEELTWYTHLATCHYLAMMTLLVDQDFYALVTSTEHPANCTSRRIIAACNNEEIVAAIESI